MNQIAFIKTGDGNITLILNAKNYSIGKSHPNYTRILQALKDGVHDDLEDLLDIPAAITSRMGGNKGSVTVQHGQVYYRGSPMHNTVTERILAFLNEGLPTEPLVRFLENLLENPMPEAVKELYDFLENTSGGRSQFPITEDGCFIGYKGISADWKDAYTGKIDNTIGTIVSMGRDKVDPNRRNECSYGLHVGTLEYARGFAARTILVKVNPRDCIAVPQDYNCSKLRVCQYEVLAEAENVIETPMYPMPSSQDDYDDEDDMMIVDDYIDDDFEDEVETELTAGAACHTQVVKTVKRKPCAYCGAKGGKKHAKKCKRPRKS
jgi:hypothetical protein